MIKSKSLLMALSVPVLAGCNSLGGVPEFTQSAISPQALHPGDTALITIDAKDRNDIIHSVVGVVEEEPSLKLSLRDDGQEGDVTADDDIWSLAVKVPIEARPGTFSLKFTAYRSDGVPVPIRGEDGSVGTLTAEMPLQINATQ